MATDARTPEQLEDARVKAARDAALKAKQKEADEANKTRTGVGTRMEVGMTRGKNPIVISWEAFDESKPETLPKSIDEFTSVTGKSDEKELLSFLITGLNASNYTAASDPLAEFVEDYWPADVQNQFRLVVRNYARGAEVPIEEAVDLVKPGFVKKFPNPVAAPAA